jgi:nitrogen fixation protein FixH
MREQNPSASQFTGRHMLAIMLGFFGVIIAVNVTMATFANTSWTGFVVKNSHVAGKQFNQKVADARKQDALGWSGTLTIENGVLRYELVDASGTRVPAAGGMATLRRPASDKEDTTLALTVSQAGLEASAPLADGVWIAEILVDSGQERPWRETQRVFLDGGTIR